MLSSRHSCTFPSKRPALRSAADSRQPTEFDRVSRPGYQDLEGEVCNPDSRPQMKWWLDTLSYLSIVGPTPFSLLPRTLLTAGVTTTARKAAFRAVVVTPAVSRVRGED